MLDDVIDRLVDRRFSAGFLTGQRALPIRSRVPIYGEVPREDSPPAGFRAWLNRHQPDVILALYNNVLAWLKDCGKITPENIGVVQLEWRQNRPDIAGMHQHNFVTGEAAVDMVVNQIHHGEVGVLEFPRATLIGATWMPGLSIRSS